MADVTELAVKWAEDEGTTSTTRLATYCRQLMEENARLRSTCGVIEPYEPLPFSHRSYIGEPGWFAKWEKEYASALEVAQRNTERMQRNAEVLDRLVKTITAAGIATQTYTWKRNKRVDVVADWLAILRNSMPPATGTVDQLERRNREMQERYCKEVESAEQQKRNEEATIAAEERHRREMASVVVVAQSLQVDPVAATRESVEGEIRRRDKYIDLAMGGMQTRGDWNDGPWAAEAALGRFIVETDVDKEIVEEWSEMLSDFEDGRCFRDAMWGYDRVMALADQSLVELLGKLNQ